MQDTDTGKSPALRPPRVLFAAPACLFDTSSGAAITVREVLAALSRSGVEVASLEASVCDAQVARDVLQPALEGLAPMQSARINEGRITHQLMVTASHNRVAMTTAEESRFFMRYLKQLQEFRPDMVMLLGGHLLEAAIAHEARRMGIATVAFLYNGNYRGRRWCRDIDLVLTDSRATSELYAEREGIDVTPIGTFINPQRVVATDRNPRELLFINPAWQKGAVLVAYLALYLEQRRPDIRFTVVESRGRWAEVVRHVTREQERVARDSLTNVRVEANRRDMRPLYARARMLLAPSLWWESGARVLGEALLNGVPVITTDYGGSPEMVGKGGILLSLPGDWHEPPFRGAGDPRQFAPLVERIEQLFDDETAYAGLVERTRQEARQRHDIVANTRRLMTVLDPFWATRTGDRIDELAFD